ncbi:oxidoreductase [Mycobacterium lentiflavum]|uniref:Oxidoreductase n=1 Tax=Mycobacterium lentiflavum TaxID=141349 RepID=A0A0E4CNS4_MYCLN|nr:NADP-dependent oxidoreductase [Mycobacterium lentiflavum]CQD15005.1 oxidoreductase [Mycobacterium lentiflavum]
MTMPKRIQYHHYGGSDLLRLEEFEPADLRRGEVLVRMRAAGANPLDWKVRNGQLRVMSGRTFPRGLGHDFSGTVERVGAGVTQFRAGDAVLGATSMRAAGAFAEMVVAEAKKTAHKPADLSFEEAAALPTIGVTALQALEGLNPGQTVFVTGCLGGVGRVALQLARNQGLVVSGSCRKERWEEARSLGARIVVGFDFDPNELEGQFDLVFDTPGVLPASKARALLRPGGRIIFINATPLKIVRSLFPGPSRMQFSEPNTKDLENLAEAVAEGTIELQIGRSVPLLQAIPALKELEEGKEGYVGKLVITNS